MNNEIKNNVNNYTTMNKYDKNITQNLNAHEITSEIASQDNSQIENSLNFLGSINKLTIAKKTKDNVKQSVLSFQSDPLNAELCNGIYDTFIERGYNAQQAINMTDNMIKILKDKNTYKD